MGRRSFNLAVIVSILFVACVVMIWGLSFSAERQDDFRGGGLSVFITIARGAAVIDIRRLGPAAATRPSAWHAGTTFPINANPPIPSLRHEFLDLGYGVPTTIMIAEQRITQNLRKFANATKNELATLQNVNLRELGLTRREDVETLRNNKVIELAQIEYRLAELTPASRIGFPLWLVALLGCIVPTALVVRARNRRRNQRDGLCVVCGYDLRATPDRCPECGAVAAG